MGQESLLQARILDDLVSMGWVVHKVVLSSKDGWTDIEAFRNKIAIFIECKAPGKKARPLQEYRHDQLRGQGFDVLVIDSWPLYQKLKPKYFA